MARFFIDRPIFAWVIAIIIMMSGAIALTQLPVAQYPNIAPPMVTVTATYPGASAQTVENTVTQVIEQKMKGIDHLTYISSTSDATGAAQITLTFDAGTNIDTAQVQVQNKLQLAMPSLPEAVQRQGVSVTKSAMSFLVVVGFVSTDKSMNAADISDYVYSNIQDPLSRVSGVGELTIFGAQYAMRIWCNPERFREFDLMPSDVIAAIQAQNAQVPGGQLGGLPSIEGQQINLTVNAANLMQTREQFENIILRTLPSGAALRLKDVARVDLDSENFQSLARYNGEPAAALAVKLASGANALATQQGVLQKVHELSKFFPAGLKDVYPFDTTPFVRIAIDEVYKTLAEAVFLVFCVMYLFLQNFRATLIPTIAVPVVLLGTFGVLAVAGFSINTLTMFGMVLAIGLLVDDAIVVVENVERLMQEEHLSPKEAAKKSMDQITGALVGIGMVLSAVFIPMAFFGGSVGVIYRQFSITIVSAMALSVLVALILTPALCATMLKPHQQGATKYGFFGRFNRWFDKISGNYQNRVAKMISKPLRYLLIYGACVGLMAYIMVRLPTSFFPDEDQGIVFTMAQLPPTSTLENTVKVLEQIEHHFLVEEKDNVEGLITVAGFSFAGSGQNTGMGFVRLKDWNQRKSATQHVQAIVGRAYASFARIKEAMVFAFAPPAVLEMGNATGFEFRLMDMAGLGHDALMQANGQMMNMIYNPAAGIMVNGEAPGKVLTKTRQNGLPDVDELRLAIDLPQAGAQGVAPQSIYSTIAAFWGGAYVNDFMDRGRTKKVYLQADKQFRMQEKDFDRYYVRNDNGQMVPLSNFVSTSYGKASPRLERFNGVPSLQFLGEAQPGRSSGEAMLMMEGLAEKLPPGFGYAWSGLSYQERLSGAQAPILYAISIVVVFLCLAALYESWSVPFSVLLVVPLGVLGAVAGVMVRGMSNDVYFQVGLLAVIGLSAKNSILIVEFAKDLHEAGQELLEATLHAVRMRLRPIIMTSLAFILGVMPLAISNGAGSGSQNAIGTAVVAGTFVATCLGIFFTPIFFVLICSFFMKKKKQTTTEGAHHE